MIYLGHPSARRRNRVIRAHVRAAILEGATMAEVAEIVALTILSRGMVAYRMGGYDALIAAEQALAERRSG